MVERELFRTPVSKRHWIVATDWPAAVYAIGDVHGCLEELRTMEDAIDDDRAEIEGNIWIVLLGDLIDRGPQSAGVMEHVLSPPPEGARRICLAGNHEAMMLDFLMGRPSYWLENGGIETLKSYGVEARELAFLTPRSRADALTSHIPSAHIAHLEQAPIGVSLPGVTLVHAGVRLGIPLSEQSEEDLLWIREPFLNAKLPADHLIVHGHTPSREPQVVPGRLGIDTGAFATGRLTAARLTLNDAPKIFTITA